MPTGPKIAVLIGSSRLTRMSDKPAAWMLAQARARGDMDVELQMVPTRGAVHIGGADFFTIFPMGGDQPMAGIEANLQAAATTTLDDLAWWAKATMAARAAA